MYPLGSRSIGKVGGLLEQEKLEHHNQRVPQDGRGKHAMTVRSGPGNSLETSRTNS